MGDLDSNIKVMERERVRSEILDEVYNLKFGFVFRVCIRVWLAGAS